jgi:alpha-glucosidase (family GH31 glycosyl hydrolase)
VATVWIPPGTWIDWFSGAQVRGPQVRSIDVPLDRMPLYVRAGALVATQPEAATTPAGSAASLVLTAYPGARTGRATVYDDGGDGLAYLAGRSARIPVTQRRRGRRVTVTIGPERGRFAGLPSTRSWEVRVLGDGGAAVTRRVRAGVRKAVRVSVVLPQP